MSALAVLFCGGFSLSGLLARFSGIGTPSSPCCLCFASPVVWLFVVGRFSAVPTPWLPRPGHDYCMCWCVDLLVFLWFYVVPNLWLLLPHPIPALFCRSHTFVPRRLIIVTARFVQALPMALRVGLSCRLPLLIRSLFAACARAFFSPVFVPFCTTLSPSFVFQLPCAAPINARASSMRELARSRFVRGVLVGACACAPAAGPSAPVGRFTHGGRPPCPRRSLWGLPGPRPAGGPLGRAGGWRSCESRY